jgi:beta-lactamase class A
MGQIVGEIDGEMSAFNTRLARGSGNAVWGLLPDGAHRAYSLGMRIVFAVLIVLPAIVRAQPTLSAQIAERVAQVPGAFIGVVYRPIGGTNRVAINADSLFHAASTMKVPVMIEFFRRVDTGGLSIDQPILLVNQFGSIVDGSPYSLRAGDDSDSAMYRQVGQRVPARALVERMIVRSSNLATNAVIALLGAAEVTATARRFGARTMSVLRGVEDGKAFQRGLNNTTSARDLAALLEGIETRTVASPASCEAMLGILSRQEFNDEIPAGLPPGTRVAHKTGQITAVMHDAAVVYPTNAAPYLLVVLTRGIPDEKIARRLIADLSRLVWDDATRSPRAPPSPRDRHLAG